ncbi:rac GTPase-activating protein 1-like [Leptopilina boulardi]|uniref:rac GTPase-activating protein 1-like n=1 Tax=Leptopilina boulardi TaxID=63433 RepID=UPI0021F69B67|nr:rac GTPase-activating protein 1-like [Leptopilina boulardi]XP_051155608.1 rac GTPase-activating protein 1-like [Leptopilina boulardi]
MAHFKKCLLLFFCTLVHLNGQPDTSRDESNENSPSSPKDYIPRVIIRSIQEVEKRGMKEEEIYLKKYEPKIVNELMKMMYQNSLLLSEINIHLFAACVVNNIVEKFNNGLIPEVNLCKEASEAVENNNKNLLRKVVSKLPNKNKYTIAFLMCHLLRVIRDDINKEHLLALLFAKNLFNGEYNKIKSMDIVQSRNIAIKVFIKFLNLGYQYWDEIINYASIIKLDWLTSLFDEDKLNDSFFGGKFRSSKSSFESDIEPQSPYPERNNDLSTFNEK